MSSAVAGRRNTRTSLSSGDVLFHGMRGTAWLMLALLIPWAGSVSNIDSMAPLCWTVRPNGATRSGILCTPQLWGARDATLINASMMHGNVLCEAPDGARVQGKIIVAARGTCPFSVKASLALSAGAVGLVLFDPSDER